MLDLSPEKVLLLGIIALVVLGPTKLPHAARSLGQFVSQLRRMTASFREEVTDALGEPLESFTSVVTDLSPRSMPVAIRRVLDPGLNPPSGRGGTDPASPPGTYSSPSYGDLGSARPPDDPSLN